MILVDFAAIAFASIHVNIRESKATTIEENNVRHMLLNQLLSFKRKYGTDYGEIVLCLEARGGNWRKDYFPNYKIGRAKSRAVDGIDWETVFKTVGKITEEIDMYLPYKAIRVDKLEGDDVIAILAKNANTLMKENEQCLIISNDKDFKQLQIHPWVKQFSPYKGIFLTEDHPKMQLFELICKGDTADGIPNIKSNINSLADGVRQKPVTAKFIQQFREYGVQMLTEAERTRFMENSKLIAFDFIPEEYVEPVIAKYKEKKVINRFDLYKYFVRNGEKELAEKFEEF